MPKPTASASVSDSDAESVSDSDSDSDSDPDSDRGPWAPMRAAAGSVPLNLAEGNLRLGADRLHPFRIAAGSAAELRTALRSPPQTKTPGPLWAGSRFFVTPPGAASGFLDVRVEHELVRMRAQADLVGLLRSLVLDPGGEHVLREHVALEQVLVVLLEVGQGLV